jgi:putative ABC transport system permease protein
MEDVAPASCAGVARRGAMIRHLMKLVWNRKRFNFLITVEIFVSFLVLFVVMMFIVYYANNYRQPLGFDYENVWNVNIDVKQQSDDYFTPEQQELTRQLYLAVRDMPEVESVASILSAPYQVGGSFGGMEINGKDIMYERGEVTDGLKEVLNLNIVAGRWFSKEDDAANYRPVVINRHLAEEMYGAEDPIGKPFGSPGRDEKESRVVGMVSDFRKQGEFSGLGNFMFTRKNLNDPKDRPPRNLLLKIRPGVSAEFEERLATKLQAVAKNWSFEVSPLVNLRESLFRLQLTPILVLGIIAAFLMIMVALGLTGVLWQSVTQRRKEIGLRRAKGATAGNIYKQILGELFIITSFGLLFGVLVVVQFPLLDLISFISAKIYLYSILASALMIYLLTILCGLYPSRLATKVRPAEALHYE